MKTGVIPKPNNIHENLDEKLPEVRVVGNNALKDI